MAKKKGETSVKVYQDWCKGCGICVAFCPAKVLKINNKNKAEVVQEDECINCGFCEVHCPDFAILVRPKNETQPKKPRTNSQVPPPAEAEPVQDKNKKV